MTSPTTPVPVGVSRDRRYFPELEALRGVAILLVVVFHADAVLLSPFRDRIGTWPNPALAFVWAGHSGVSLFFVLSGFLLSLPFLEEAYGGRRVARSQFYRRRVLRILPLYYAAVLAGTVLTAATVADLWRGVPYLFFLESKPGFLAPLSPWSEVWWSLATEVQFYAVLPLLAYAFGRPRQVTLALLAAYALGYTAVALGWVVPQLEPFFRAQSVGGRSPVFLCGIGAAWVWFRHGPALRARFARTSWLTAGGGDAILLALLIALGCLLRWATFHGFMPLEQSERFVWHAPEGLLWAAVTLAILLLPLRSRLLLSNRALATLGVLSYSIYILHLPVLRYTLIAARWMFPGMGAGWSALGAAWFVVAAALCLGLGALTYRVVERPFLVRKARVGPSGLLSYPDAVAQHPVAAGGHGHVER